MNLVKQIVDQLSGDALHKLGSLLGIDHETTEYAVGAAVPSLLAGLADMATRPEGARKLATAFGGIDSGSFGDFARALDSDPSNLMLHGGQMLQGLLGENAISNLVGAVGSYAGLDSAGMRNLLAYLAPLVLGTVARQWKQRGANPQALQSLFAEQKANIANSVPAGFSLEDVPGLAGFTDSANAAAGAARRTAEQAAPSLASWLVPLAILIGCGFLIWQFLRPGERPQLAADDRPVETTVMKPVVPDSTPALAVPQVQDQLTGVFRSLESTLTGIRDSATAESAVPALEETSTKLDALVATIRDLPQTGRTALRQFVDDQLGSLKSAAGNALAIPGLSDRVKTLIQNIMTKLDELQTASTAAA